jgi:hypothetical protein
LTDGLHLLHHAGKELASDDLNALALACVALAHGALLASNTTNTNISNDQSQVILSSVYCEVKIFNVSI